MIFCRSSLLLQAEQELLAQELEIVRLQAALARMNTQKLVLQVLARPTPFAFPLMVERFREQLSNENVADRIARMVAQLDQAADNPAVGRALEAASPKAGSALENVRLALAFSQDARSSQPRLATGRRRPGL